MKPFRYSLAATLCALAIPAAAHAGSINNQGGGAITINDSPATSAPYPSTLDITGGDGPISEVQAVVTLTHNNINDLDLVLVSPSGDAVVLMSDACGTGTLPERTFVFSSAGGPLPQAGPCPNGTYQPTNYDTADNWPAPGPGPVTSASLSNFGSASANGDWKLFARDDSPFQAGAISSWGLFITTGIAPNVIPLSGTSGVATPYPSTKTFNTPAGQVIDDVNLTITAFNHEHPDDVDMMLQGPTGETVMVMSDACGSTDINENFNWTFDDEATFQLSDADSTNCAAGSKKPSDFGDPENLPAPALPGPYGSSMSVFDGLPGGDFRLFVNDDASGDIGYFNGWNLTMTTRPPAATGFGTTTVATAEGQTAQLTVNRLGSANVGAATVDVAVNDGDTDSRDFSHIVPTKLQFARGEASKTIEIPINADPETEQAETFQVTLANATGDAALADAISSATVTIARSEPDNRFTVGKLKRLRNGSARLEVTIPNPGTLAAEDAGPKALLKPTEVDASKAGKTTITLKPARKAKRKLKRGKKVKLTAEITYKPDGGSANRAKAPVTLKRGR